MTRVERSVKLSCQPERAFEQLTDLDRLPYWSSVTDDIGDISDRPLKQGSTFRQTVRIAGKSVASQWRVVELERPLRAVFEGRGPQDGKLLMAQTITPTGDGCRVALEIDYDVPAGFFGEALDRLYVERRIEREVERTLENLQDMLEGQRSS